jgi:Outer membrane protein beta-barrel domain
MRLGRILCSSLIVATTVAAFSASKAQTPTPRRLGITAGLNSASFGGTSASNQPPERHQGFIGGAFLVAPINRRVAFQPELLFTMKGAGYTNQVGSGVFKVNYFEVPLLVRYEVEPSEGLRPFFLAGPGVAFKASCNVTVSNLGPTQSSSCADIAAQGGSGVAFRSLDYGMIFGGGFEFDFHGKTLTGAGRYNYGLAKIEKSSSIRNRVVSLLTALEFPLSRK